MKGKKTGGRTRGTPNKATTEAREACARIVDDGVYRRTLARRARTGKLAPAVECMLWYYAYGKPKELVEHSGPASDQMRSIIVVAPGAELPPELTAGSKGEYER